MTIIKEFKGEYEFLSNFGRSEFILDGNLYPTVEHYYQANKAANLADKTKILGAKTPGKAKRIGGEIELRPSFENEKLTIMYRGVLEKFKQNQELRKKLIETGSAVLQEGNLWGDTLWGVDLRTGEGENHLGKILMEVRNALREENQK